MVIPYIAMPLSVSDRKQSPCPAWRGPIALEIFLCYDHTRFQSRIKGGGRLRPPPELQRLETRGVSRALTFRTTGSKVVGESRFGRHRWSCFASNPHDATGLRVYLRGALGGHEPILAVLEGGRESTAAQARAEKHLKKWGAVNKKSGLQKGRCSRA